MVDFGAALKNIKITEEDIDNVIDEVRTPDLLPVLSEKQVRVAALETAYDLAPVRAKFEHYAKAMNGLKTKAVAHKITDDETNTQAVEMASQIKTVFKQIEDARKAIVERPKKFTSAVDTFSREYKQICTGIEDNLKSKISYWFNECEKARATEERKAQKEQAALQKKLDGAAAKEQAKLDAKAKKEGVEPEKVESVVAPAPVIQEAPKKTTTSAGTASIKKAFTHTVVDLSLVPREYLTLDEKQVKAAVKAGIRNIPGLSIFEELKTQIRTR